MASLRNGYSTGTCAAAASKAALQKLMGGDDIFSVDISLPSGETLTIPVQKVFWDGNATVAEVIKDGGDDLDVTHGMRILSRVEWGNEPGIVIEGDAGIGRVTKPGLAVSVGEWAINPVPRKMIRNALDELLPDERGLRVTISAPDGEKISVKTMNERLGITGGISILGTSGLVRPMSQEAFIESLLPQISQARALGKDILVLTPGAMGSRMAAERGIDSDAIIQTSNFIGAMLEACASSGATGILLFGHIGKLVKIAAGIFNTHSKLADARRETLAAYAALRGASREVIVEIMKLNALDAAFDLLFSNRLTGVYNDIADAASQRSQQLIGRKIMIGTVVYALNGQILGHDERALELGRKLGWQIL